LDTETMMVVELGDMSPEEVVLVLRHLQGQGYPATFTYLEGEPVIVISLPVSQNGPGDGA
jgi:hypothetical protein